MNPKIADIQQVQFVVIGSSIHFILQEHIPQNISELPIDIEFDIYTNPEFDHNFRLVLIINVNADAALSGYAIELEIGSEFILPYKVELDKAEFAVHLKNTALPCVINQIRVFLQNVTSFYPAASYVLPMIDINDLWEKRFHK